MYCLYYRCSGYLIVFHYKQSESDQMSSVRKSTLGGKSYKNLTNGLLKGGRVVMKVQSEGECCWDIFSNIRFHGESQVIQPGYDDIPNFTPKSIKRRNC